MSLHIVFFNIGDPGHINPTLYVVSALVKAGCKVSYFTYPSYKTQVEAMGATYYNYGYDEFDIEQHNIGVMFKTMAIQPAAVALMPSLLQKMKKFNPAPSLIVHDSFALWGAYSAMVLGIPFVMSHGSDINVVTGDPATEAQMVTMLDFTKNVINECALQTLHNTYGLTSVTLADVKFPASPYLNVVYSTKEFSAAGVDDSQFRGPYAFVGPQVMPGPLTEANDVFMTALRNRMNTLPSATRKLIYISLGTQDAPPDSFFTACFSAFGPHEDWLVIMVCLNNMNFEEGVVPANFIMCTSAPQLYVLAITDLFISHCGFNSLLESLWYGVPMICVPYIGDQKTNARRAVEFGVGIMLDRDTVTGEEMETTVVAALEDTVLRQAALNMRTHFRSSDKVEEFAQTLMTMAQGGQVGGSNLRKSLRSRLCCA